MLQSTQREIQTLRNVLKFPIRHWHTFCIAFCLLIDCSNLATIMIKCFPKSFSEFKHPVPFKAKKARAKPESNQSSLRAFAAREVAILIVCCKNRNLVIK